MDVYSLHSRQRFVWDRAKAESNVVKHGVFFEQAIQAFFEVFAVFEDASRMGDESRMAVIGLVSNKKILYVVHLAPEGGDSIRIISARHVTARERKRYEDE